MLETSLEKIKKNYTNLNNTKYLNIRKSKGLT